jgi:dodecin
METSVYKIIEIIGTSPTSWEDATKTAIETAAGTLEDLRIAEVVKQDVTIENGKVTGFRVRLTISFKYHPSKG